MKKLILFLIAILIVGTYVNDGFAQEKLDNGTSVKLDVTAGLGILNGHTTYQIGGVVSTPSGSDVVHFPISELEFPLDVWMVSLGADVRFADKLKLSANVQTNITNDAGKMKDSDWGAWWLDGYVWAEQGTLDIYSESDADLDALIVDVNARYNINKKFLVGLGYIHQNFDYEVSNVDESYPSSYYYSGVDAPHSYVSGLVLTYEITYSIPYIEIVFTETNDIFLGDPFIMEVSLGYSPVVRAEDEDHHLLRSKVNKGDYDEGTAIFFSLGGRYEFETNWFFSFQFDYKEIKADGKSDAYFSGVYDHTIDIKTESKQKDFFMNIGYVF